MSKKKVHKDVTILDILERLISSRLPTYIYVLCDPRYTRDDPDNYFRYVGKSNDPESRRTSHIGDANRGCKTHRSCWIREMAREGYDPISETIGSCQRRYWQQYEIYHVSQYNNLTNHTKGGNGSHSLSKEQIEKQKESRKRNKKKRPPISELTRKRMSEGLKGKKRSEETKKNMSLGGTLYPVCQFTEDKKLVKIWDYGIPEAARELGIPSKRIRHAVRGKTKVVANSRWKYLKDYERDLEDFGEVQFIDVINIEKPIQQYSLDQKFIKEFSNASEASRQTKINGALINSCVLGKIPTAGNYFWKFSKDVEEELLVCGKLIFPDFKPFKKIVLQFDLNKNYLKEWESSAEAGRQLGFRGVGISDCAGGSTKTAYGYFWKYKADIDKELKEFGEIQFPELKPVKRVAKCNLDGDYLVIYPDIQTALIGTPHLNHQTSISNCLLGKNKTGGGYVWKHI